MNRKGYLPIPVGLRTGEIDGVEVLTGTPRAEDLHAISLYLNPTRQSAFYEYILGLKPKYLIFNPGTENTELFQMAKQEGIIPMYACNLVMLSLGNLPE